MNTKHLSCTLLFLVVLGLLQGIIVLNKKMLSAMTDRDDAAGRREVATRDRTTAQIALDKNRKDSAAHRKFLEMWQPKLTQTGNENSAKKEFNLLLKRFMSLTSFANTTSSPVENKEMSYINRRITSSVRLEGDAEKAIQFLASVERDLATSRIQSLEIRKGQRGNDVELNLAVETPLLPAPAAK